MCEIIFKKEASNVNLTDEQRDSVEPFFVQFLNRTKITPDPLEIAEAVTVYILLDL